MAIMPSIYDLIETIRPRPGMYIARRSLALLDCYIRGYLHAVSDLDAPLHTEVPPFYQFFDWVARKYGWSESTSGWANIISQELGSEEAAFAEFFVLLDEFKKRRPTVVATVRPLPEQHWTGAVRRWQSWAGRLDEVELPPPREARIVRYSSDAGCFLEYEYPEPFGPDESYFPSTSEAIAQVQKELGIPADQWTMTATHPPA